MSNKVEELASVLSASGNSAFISNLLDILHLSETQRSMLGEFLLTNTQADREYLEGVKNLLSTSTYKGSTAADLYARNPIGLQFIRHLQQLGSIFICGQDVWSVKILNPRTDITIASMNSAHNIYRVYVYVKVQIETPSDSISMSIRVNVFDYQNKSACEWIKDIVAECTNQIMSPFIDGYTCALSELDTSLQNLAGDSSACLNTSFVLDVLSQFVALLLYVKSFGPLCDTSRSTLAKYVGHLCATLTATYMYKDMVDTALINHLLETSKKIEFIHATENTLIIDNIYSDGQDAVIFAKNGGHWIRDNKGNQDYKRLQLARRLAK